mgnify:CR=1 FL=1
MTVLEVLQRLKQDLHARVRGIEPVQALLCTLPVEGLEVAGRQRELEAGGPTPGLAEGTTSGLNLSTDLHNL